MHGSRAGHPRGQVRLFVGQGARCKESGLWAERELCGGLCDCLAQG